MNLKEFTSIAIIYDRINREIIETTISIRQKHKIKLPDAIIAATAIVYGLTIATRNISDFKNIEGLNCINPWDL